MSRHLLAAAALPLCSVRESDFTESVCRGACCHKAEPGPPPHQLAHHCQMNGPWPRGVRQLLPSLNICSARLQTGPVGRRWRPALVSLCHRSCFLSPLLFCDKVTRRLSSIGETAAGGQMTEPRCPTVETSGGLCACRGPLGLREGVIYHDGRKGRSRESSVTLKTLPWRKYKRKKYIYITAAAGLKVKCAYVSVCVCLCACGKGREHFHTTMCWF